MTTRGTGSSRRTKVTGAGKAVASSSRWPKKSPPSELEEEEEEEAMRPKRRKTSTGKQAACELVAKVLKGKC
jgi:hypothetical protein